MDCDIVSVRRERDRRDGYVRRRLLRAHSLPAGELVPTAGTVGRSGSE